MNHESADDVEYFQDLVDVLVVRFPFDDRFLVDVQYLVIVRNFLVHVSEFLVVPFRADGRFLVVIPVACQVLLPFRAPFGKLQSAVLGRVAFLPLEYESDLLSDVRKGPDVVQVEGNDLVELQSPERVVGHRYVFVVHCLEYDVYQWDDVDRDLVGVDAREVGVGYDHDDDDVVVVADVACEYAAVLLRSEDLKGLVVAESEETGQIQRDAFFLQLLLVLEHPKAIDWEYYHRKARKICQDDEKKTCL